MLTLIDKFLAKLVSQGLVGGRADVELYALDDELASRGDTFVGHARRIFSHMNINSLIIGRPHRTYHRILKRLCRDHPELITPQDSESVTFLHDIPIVEALDAEELMAALEHRKGCIIREAGLIATRGTVSLEQAFVTFSSICFALFVKYFTDTLTSVQAGGVAPPDLLEDIRECKGILDKVSLAPQHNLPDTVSQDEHQIRTDLACAGRAMVASSLVDSFFGNVSIRSHQRIFISQTGASLDELEGCIDRTEMDGSSTCDITSSSELCSHVRIYELTDAKVILHGHPRFCVIMSMVKGAPPFGEISFIEGIPVVSGEVGAGKRGILHTLPPAMKKSLMAVVAGHGAFAASATSVRDAFDRLSGMERTCMAACRRILAGGSCTLKKQT